PFPLPGPLTGLSKPYAPIHRRKGKLPSPVADGAVQVPRAELTRDEEGKVRHQVAVHRGSTDFGREVGGQVERDAAVHRGELDAQWSPAVHSLSRRARRGVG